MRPSRDKIRPPNCPICLQPFKGKDGFEITFLMTSHKCSRWVHKRTQNFELYCGQYYAKAVRQSYAWKDITCLKCLKYKNPAVQAAYRKSWKEKQLRAAAAKVIKEALLNDPQGLQVSQAVRPVCRSGQDSFSDSERQHG